MKKPEYAKLYGDQIKEMEDMRFSRKLTKEEIKKWKAPIRYVAHHTVVRPEMKIAPIRIVFNSSASFDGHRLNDYWFKGPDLLNNLSGVPIPFGENHGALCT